MQLHVFTFVWSNQNRPKTSKIFLFLVTLILSICFITVSSTCSSLFHWCIFHHLNLDLTFSTFTTLLARKKSVLFWISENTTRKGRQWNFKTVQFLPTVALVIWLKYCRCLVKIDDRHIVYSLYSDIRIQYVPSLSFLLL